MGETSTERDDRRRRLRSRGVVVAIAAALVAGLSRSPPTPQDVRAPEEEPFSGACLHASTPMGLVAACFAPGTSPEYMERLLARAEAAGGRNAVAKGISWFRWRRTATDAGPVPQGDPLTITWAVVADGTPVPGALGEAASGSDLRAWLGGIYGSEAAWLAVFQKVFDRWGELTGVTYVRETADDGVAIGTAPGVLGVRADVRIGGHDVDGASGVVAYNAYPEDADMVIDTSSTMFRTPGASSLLLRNVIAHEHGHGLALEHVCPRTATKLMEPMVTAAIDGPQHDDVLSAQRLYGDQFEPNDSAIRATDLGVRDSRKLTLRDVSVDDDGDADWYAVTVAEGTSADITLRPVGQTYDLGPEGAGGCGGDKFPVDTRNRANLRLSILTSQSDVVASADSTAAGGEESLLDVPLPLGAGTYFVRVRGSGEDDAQMYELEMRFVQRGAKPLANADAASTFEVLPVTTDVLANDEGLGDEPIAVRILQQPEKGRAIVVRRSTVFVPPAGFAGDESYVYEIRDAHGQVSTAGVDVHVEASPRAGNARVDTDGDGWPDELEVALGTDRDLPESRPGDDLTVAPPADVGLRRLLLRLDARRESRDAARVSGAVEVPAGFQPGGARVAVYVAGVVREFTLDAQGRASLPAGETLRLRPARLAEGAHYATARFSLRIPAADLAAHISDEGIDTSRRAVNEPRAATVFVLVDGRVSTVTAPLVHTARRDHSGRATFRPRR